MFNGEVAYQSGLNQAENTFDENFWEVLPVEKINIKEFLVDEDKQNPYLERAEEKAVKAVQTHGMSIKGKEKNSLIDEAYMLLGRARYYSGRFIPALEAFNYVLFKYPSSNNINTAKVWKAKTNFRLENESTAVESLNLLLQDEELLIKDQIEALSTLAQIYINKNDLELAILSLESAINIIKDKDLKGRLFFIVGQLYSLKNEPELANNSFQKVIDLNRNIARKYRINAFLEQAVNFNYNTGDLDILHDLFNYLENDRENRPFLDRIFHVIANHYMKIDKDSIAVKYFNKSLATKSKDQYLNAINYHTLADFYYDQSDYITAGEYYDSTLTKYSVNSKPYRLVEKRFENLKDVIFYENIARENDSIINLTRMSENELEIFFQPYVDKLILKLEANNNSKKKVVSKSNSLFDNSKSNDKGGFYFYQNTTVSYGRKEFINFWGDRPLADNWRWSSQANNKLTNTKKKKSDSKITGEKLTTQYFIDMLPKKQTEIDSIKKKLNIAYYKLGLIYKNKFKDYQRAISKLESLLTNEPQERLILPAKYNLYKAYKLINNIEFSDQIKLDIIDNYAESSYAKILKNPKLALKADSQSPTERYRVLYKAFEDSDYERVISDCELNILAFEGEDIVPKLELLKTIANARLYGLKAYKKGLNYLTLNYPNSNEGKEAENIIKNVIPDLENNNFSNLSEGLSFKAIFKFSSLEIDLIDNFKTSLDEAVNKEKVFELTTSQDIYDINTTFVVVHGLKSISGALGFVELLEIESDEILSKSYFAISSANYKTLQIHKNLDSYLELLNKKN